MKKLTEKSKRRNRRKKHIRKRISGTTDRPRMTVYKSNKNMYVQVIDDTEGKSIASASNIEKQNRNLKKCVADAEKLGEIIGNRLKEKNINSVVFDRNGYIYHGIIKAIADGTRKTGIQF